ncbi:MAG: hypothetical protein M0Z99_21585 [Betaproteobacteria bacterium]|nr:hypothetical protein [Betaproteobacteria bacterium]
MAYPGENAVPVQVDAGFFGIKRSGRNKIHFRATANEKYIP